MKNKTIEQQIAKMFENINSGKGGMYLMIVDDSTDEIVRIESDVEISIDEMVEIINSYP